MSTNAKTEPFINIADRVRPFGRGDGSGGGGTGAQGPIGPVGPTGPQGPKGDDGADGLQGQKGDPGTNGLAGAPGQEGLRGVQGVQGLKGDKGDAGPLSPAGLTWRGAWDNATAYVLNDTVGYNGASYFCISAHTGSQPTENVNDTKWALIAAQGAKGDAGADGQNGLDGQQGIAGVNGVKGDQGIPGLPGPQGVQGAKGDQGDQGPQGAGAGQMEVVLHADRGTGAGIGEMKWVSDRKAIIIWDGTGWVTYGVPASAPDSEFTPATGGTYNYGQSVIFTDASFDNDGTVTAREWSNNFNSDVGTGSTYEVTLPIGSPGDTGQNVQVSLKVTDDSGLMNSQTQDYTLQIAPLAPTTLTGGGAILSDDGLAMVLPPIVTQAEMIFNAGGANPDNTDTFYTT